ncbi:MAG: hypothetical protein ACFFCS_27550 [Candidatus Hodarchaeota archaeon]
MSQIHKNPDFSLFSKDIKEEFKIVIGDNQDLDAIKKLLKENGIKFAYFRILSLVEDLNS